MYTEHPYFAAPADDSKLWRYMDFAKLAWLAAFESLYFARADTLSDRWEGATSRITFAQRPEMFKAMIKNERWAESLAAFQHYRKEDLRKETYLSCWHENDEESAAMWGLYGREAVALAVQTRFERLKSCFRDKGDVDIYIGKVRYVDYRSDQIPDGNTFLPFLHKRRSFSHEREVRAVIQHSKPDTPYAREGGLAVPIDPGLLIENVYITPAAPVWVKELVASVLHRYDLSQVAIVHSNLSEDPVY